jgi:hypothetical protein
MHYAATPDDYDQAEIEYFEIENILESLNEGVISPI